MFLWYLSSGSLVGPLFGRAWYLRLAASVTWSACGSESSVPRAGGSFPWLLVAWLCGFVLLGVVVVPGSWAFRFRFPWGLESVGLLVCNASSIGMILEVGWVILRLGAGEGEVDGDGVSSPGVDGIERGGGVRFGFGYV
jgi:hypothetical protein